MSDSEANGNTIETAATGSVEDLSEYTDADESMSAPTEILAEFLSAIMLKDYETALKYCKIILHYEPNNSTAKEFYPILAEKIEIMRAEQNESGEDSSSDCSSSASGIGSDQSLTSGDESELQATDSDDTSASYSSLEDDEAENIKETEGTSLITNDIANGNVKISKGTGSSIETVTSAVVALNGNSELKKKLGNIIECKAALPIEHVNDKPFARKRTNTSFRAAYPSIRKSIGPCKDEEDSGKSVMPGNAAHSPLRTSCSSAIEFDGNLNYSIFCSGSESSSDPTLHKVKCTIKSVVGDK